MAEIQLRPWVWPARGAAAGMLAGILVAGLVPSPGRSGAEPPGGAAPEGEIAREYPQGGISRWLSRVDSVHLKARVRTVLGRGGSTRRAAEDPEWDPDAPVLGTPDGKTRPGEQSAQKVVEGPRVEDAAVEMVFDRSRYWCSTVTRAAGSARVRSKGLRVWDGRRGIDETCLVDFNHREAVLLGDPYFVVEDNRVLAALNRQPRVFWWNGTGDRKIFEWWHGVPADYVRVGRETFHGVDCHVYLCLGGADMGDRYYVGVRDGLWYGAREGCVDYPAALRRAYRLANEFLKRPPDAERRGDPKNLELDLAWDEVKDELLALPPEQKAAWGRLYWSREARNLRPGGELWFSDYRDLGGGRFFPFRQDAVSYGLSDRKKPRVCLRQRVRVEEILLDRPVKEDLFRVELKPGTEVRDWATPLALTYRYDGPLEPEEWAFIVEAGRKRAAEWKGQLGELGEWLGRPAPPLPTEGWVNGKPVTWADLRGRVVVLLFWSAHQFNCYGNLPWLRGSGGDGAANDRLVFVGIHAADSSREEVERFVARHRLTAPVCLDRKGSEGFAGAFFERCGLKSAPAGFAVDEQGRVLSVMGGEWAVRAAGRRVDELAAGKP